MVKDATRSALLAHGTQLILEKGFNNTGVLAVLDAAGVPRGSFYHHFRSKEEFGIEIIRKYFQDHLTTVERFLSDVTLPPLDRLRACFEFYVAHFEARGCREGCLLGNLSQEMADLSPTFRTLLQELLGTWVERVAVCLGEAQQAGDLAAHLDPRATAEYCVNSWEGAILRMKLTKDIAPLRLFLDFFFASVRPVAATGSGRKKRR